MRRVEVVKSDITMLEVDAIVNAANSSLLGGGGVDGAIHRAAGPKLLEECRKILARQGSCNTGEAVITSAADLKAKHVIHTVGPVWNGGQNNEETLLESCYLNCFSLAVANNIETIAFPNISTGIYGFPKGRAAEIATTTTRNFLKENKSLRKIIFCCYDEENFKVYQSILDS
jgi:O-acetyl-ADP-ribose deacetylase